MELVHTGDDAAFELLFERHAAGVLSFCRHMLGSQDEAEEAIQHAFVSVHLGILQATGGGISFKPWVYTIARNHCASVLRGRRTVAAERSEPSTAGLRPEVEQRSDLREIIADIERLPEDQRAAFVLAELRDLSFDEIAEVVGQEPAAIKGLVFRARSTMIERREARRVGCVDVRESLETASRNDLAHGPLRYHLDICPDCTAYLASMRRQRKLLGFALPVVPAVALKESVMASVGGGGAGVGAGAAGAGAGAGAAGTAAGGVAGSAAIAGGAATTGASLIGGGVLAKVAVIGALAAGTGVAADTVRDDRQGDRDGAVPADVRDIDGSRSGFERLGATLTLPGSAGDAQRDGGHSGAAGKAHASDEAATTGVPPAPAPPGSPAAAGETLPLVAGGLPAVDPPAATPVESGERPSGKDAPGGGDGPSQGRGAKGGAPPANPAPPVVPDLPALPDMPAVPDVPVPVVPDVEVPPVTLPKVVKDGKLKLPKLLPRPEPPVSHEGVPAS